MLQEFRCSKCNKLLGKIEGRAEIVCIRCKVLNAFNVPEYMRLMMESEEFQDEYQRFKEAHDVQVTQSSK